MSPSKLHSRPKVLLIDDDPAIASAISARLSKFDVEVLTAYFGTQGIWSAVTEKPDVIITDIRMPNGNGDYLVDCLKGRDDTHALPLIVLTGSRDLQMETEMRSLGIEHYLHKPVKFEELLQAISRFVVLTPRVAMQIS